jgi:DNA-binding Xre family transcriptional regulator
MADDKGRRTRRVKPTSQPESPGVVEQLRDAIRTSGQSLTKLSEICGVGADRLSRFMRGERDLTFSAVERICTVLDLQLSKRKPPRSAQAK